MIQHEMLATGLIRVTAPGFGSGRLDPLDIERRPIWLTAEEARKIRAHYLNARDGLGLCETTFRRHRNAIAGFRPLGPRS